ncbi:MAG: MBL fold metallo-hydrolase [Bacillota bacterium]
MSDLRSPQLEQLDIAVIVSNRTRHGSPLWSEHGLSLLIDCHYRDEGRKRILFDTGSTGEVLGHNLKVLGVNPEELDLVFLSHCHGDHTGGLQSLIDCPESRFTVVGHAEITRQVITARAGLRHMGADPRLWESIPPRRLILLREPTQIFPAVWVSGSIPRTTSFEKPRKGQFTLDDGRLTADGDPDDMAMVFDVDSPGPVVVTGCSHAGPVNTLLHARTVCDGDARQTLIGGLHLVDADEEKLEATVKALQELNPAEIRPGHCTGTPAESALQRQFGRRHHPFNTGDRFTYRRNR